MSYLIVGSGSDGNCIIYKDVIMVDVGLPYNKIVEYLPKIKLILLTHKHSDHFNPTSIARIGKEFPNIILVVPDHLVGEVHAIDYSGRIFIAMTPQKYKVGNILVESFPLDHDVENVGWKIVIDRFKIIHATDTKSLDGVEAKRFDLYAIEHNFDEEIINETIRRKLLDGAYAHEIRTKETHLSFQKANAWIESQRAIDSEVVMLHISSSYLE